MRTSPKKATTRKVPKELTREVLLQASKRLFSKRGFEGVTVKEIAQEANVNLALISYYFGGKEGIYRACIEDFGIKKLQTSQKILVAPASQEEFELRLRLFVESMIDSYLEDPAATKMIHRECEMSIPYIEDLFRKTFLKVFENLSGYLKQAQESGYFSKSLDVSVSTVLLFGLVVHVTRTDQTYKKFFGKSLADPLHREKSIRHILHVFLHGVSTSSAQEAPEVKETKQDKKSKPSLAIRSSLMSLAFIALVGMGCAKVKSLEPIQTKNPTDDVRPTESNDPISVPVDQNSHQTPRIFCEDEEPRASVLTFAVNSTQRPKHPSRIYFLDPSQPGSALSGIQKIQVIKSGLESSEIVFEADSYSARRGAGVPFETNLYRAQIDHLKKKSRVELLLSKIPKLSEDIRESADSLGLELRPYGYTRTPSGIQWRIGASGNQDMSWNQVISQDGLGVRQAWDKNQKRFRVHFEQNGQGVASPQVTETHQIPLEISTTQLGWIEWGEAFTIYAFGAETQKIAVFSNEDSRRILRFQTIGSELWLIAEQSIAKVPLETSATPATELTWVNLPQVQRILAVGSDAGFYYVNSQDEIMHSRDGEVSRVSQTPCVGAVSDPLVRGSL